MWLTKKRIYESDMDDIVVYAIIDADNPEERDIDISSNKGTYIYVEEHKSDDLMNIGVKDGSDYYTFIRNIQKVTPLQPFVNLKYQYLEIVKKVKKILDGILKYSYELYDVKIEGRTVTVIYAVNHPFVHPNKKFIISFPLTSWQIPKNMI